MSAATRAVGLGLSTLFERFSSLVLFTAKVLRNFGLDSRYYFFVSREYISSCSSGREVFAR